MPSTDMHLGAKPILFERARRMRYNMTPAEQLFWSAVNKKQLGVKFRNQHPLMFFIADFYCHELKLVVEIDGGYIKNVTSMNTMKVEVLNYKNQTSRLFDSQTKKLNKI